MAHGWRRVVAAGALASLAAVLFASPSTAAGTTGVGSAGGTTKVVVLDAGSLMQLALLGENSASSIDPVNGTPKATESLTALTGSALAVGPFATPSVGTTSTGAPDSKNTALIDLSTLGVPGLAGTINPATLTSLVDVNGAKASLSSTLANLGVLAGVAGVDSSKVQLGGVAGPASSVANRGVEVNGITVLDLRALLNLLGLDLNKLPLSVLTNLLGQLNLIGTLNTLTGQNFANPLDIQNLVGTTQTGITTAQAAVTTAQTNVNNAQAALTQATNNSAVANAALAVCLQGGIPALCAALQSVADTLNAATASAQTLFNTVNGVLATAQSTLTGLLALLNSLLGGIAGVLDLAPLLKVESVKVSAIATAKDTVANSSAVATGAIGAITLGGVNVAGLDINATISQVQNLASQLTSQISTILSSISPQLANLVKIDLLKKTTDVSQNGSYVTAVAGITGLVATVTPPDICALLNDVLSKLPVGGNSLPGVTLPATPVPGLLTTLGAAITCNLQVASLDPDAVVPGIPALTNPVSLSAAQVNSLSNFAAAQQTTTTTTGSNPSNPNSPTTTTTTTTSNPLARTGADSMLLLLAGALLAAAALGTRRTLAVAKARR